MTEASDVALARELESLRAETLHLRKHLRLLGDLSRRVASVLDFGEVLQAVVDAACELTGAQHGALAVFDGAGDNHGLFVHGISEEERARIGELPRGLGVLGLVQRSSQPLRLADVTGHPRSAGFPAGHPPMKSFLGVAVEDDGNRAGALYLADKANDAEFSPDDEELLLLFRDQAAVAIRNARLFQREREARSQAEAANRALSESESRLQAILDNTTAIINVKDLQGRYLLMNRRYEALRGMRREDVVGKTVYDLMSKEDADIVWAHDSKVIETQTATEWEEQFTVDGEVATYLSLRFPLLDSEGQAYAICGILTDISERKRTELGLAAELGGLRALVESSPVGVIVAEADGERVISVNRQAERILGFAHQPGWVLKDYETAFVRRRPGGSTYALDEIPLRRALHRGETVRSEEVIYEFPDGRSLRLLVNATPVYSDDGRITAAVQTIQEITGREAPPIRTPSQELRLAQMTRLTGVRQPLHASASERGLERETNEDSVYCEPVDSERAKTMGWLYAVADGMGGQAMGEVASRTAIASLVDAYYGSPGGSAALADAVSRANSAVRDAGRARPEYQGMGTTLTAALIRDNHLTVAHVGDSRAYLIRAGAIRQLTEDHSWVAELVRAGAITEAQLRTMRYRNILTRSLGRDDLVQAELTEEPLDEADVLLVCSDGVSGKVADAELSAVATAQSPSQAVASLIALAKLNGSRDDASIVVARWQHPPSQAV